LHFFVVILRGHVKICYMQNKPYIYIQYLNIHNRSSIFIYFKENNIIYNMAFLFFANKNRFKVIYKLKFVKC
jgi:hypothetical protein